MFHSVGSTTYFSMMPLPLATSWSWPCNLAMIQSFFLRSCSWMKNLFSISFYSACSRWR
jgi:hypothetical protein